MLPLDASCPVKMGINPYQSRRSPFPTLSFMQNGAIYHQFMSFHFTVPGTEFSRM